MIAMEEKVVGASGQSLGDEIVARINVLAAISETPDNITRIFLTPEHRAAADMIIGWMQEAGMQAHKIGRAHV